MGDLQKPISGLSFGVLAGGKSRRMGEDKARLRLRGRSFLETVLEAGSGFPERLVSVSQDADAALASALEAQGIRVVRDGAAELGPMEGIRRLLCGCAASACLIVATDMPFLTAGFLHALAARYPGEGNLALAYRGRPEPLCSIYCRDCLPVIDRLLAEGRAKPSLLFAQVPTVFAAFEETGFPEQVLRNINRMEDYRAIREEENHAECL